MNDKPEEKEGKLLVRELYLQGHKSGESCSNTRGSRQAEKKLSSIFKHNDTGLIAEFLPSKNESTGNVLCVKKAQKA